MLFSERLIAQRYDQRRRTLSSRVLENPRKLISAGKFNIEAPDPAESSPHSQLDFVESCFRSLICLGSARDTCDTRPGGRAFWTLLGPATHKHHPMVAIAREQS